MTEVLSPAAQKEYARSLIASIIHHAPRRKPTSEDERVAQAIMRREFERLGLPTHDHAFSFNDNLYANIALHMGLGVVGTMVSGVLPAVGLVLHGLSAGSYAAESTRKGYLLRRLLGFKPSQNVLATAKSPKPPRLRVVILAHADAAFTGILFSDRVVQMNARSKVKLFARPMEMATKATAALMGFDALRMAFGPLTWPLRPIEYALTVPAFIGTVLNAEVVLRNEIVPGANDDLSGVAALPLLAARLVGTVPEDVELIFGVTGCEEASLGGGDALARDMDGVWDKRTTVVIGLDGLTNGQLRYLDVEGEVRQTPISARLRHVVENTIHGSSRFAGQVSGFTVPVGGSDIAAFLARGWEGVCLACVDPAVGSPRHYHQPSDTTENLDLDQLLFSIDFAEALTRRLIAEWPA